MHFRPQLSLVLALATLALIGFIAASIPRPAHAQGGGYAPDIEALRGHAYQIGPRGTELAQLIVTSLVYLDSATTSQVFTVNHVRAGDIVTLTPNGAYAGSAYIKSVVPTSNTLTVTWSADPGTTVPLGATISRRR